MHTMTEISGNSVVISSFERGRSKVCERWSVLLKYKPKRKKERVFLLTPAISDLTANYIFFMIVIK